MSEHVCPSDTRTDEEKAASKAAYEKFRAEHQPGIRIGFTVIASMVGSDGRVYEARYDADRLEAVFRDGDMEPMLSFVSSGRRILLEGKKVKTVEFYGIKRTEYPQPEGGVAVQWEGVQHCAGCDQRLAHVIKRPE